MKSAHYSTLKRLAPLVILLSLTACSPVNNGEEAAPPVDMEDIDVPDGFGFETRKEQILIVQVNDTDGQPYRAVPVHVFNQDLELLLAGFTDDTGRFEATFVLRKGRQRINFSTPAIGIIEADRSIELHPGVNEITVN